MVVVACTPAAPAPTAAPTAAPAAKPAEASQPAAAPAPAAPVAKPAAAARPEDIVIPKPSGQLNLKVGHPSTLGPGDAPTYITHERLRQAGWQIEDVHFAGPQLNATALSEGAVPLSVAQYSFVLELVQRQNTIRYLMENNPGEFVLIARQDLATCQGLNGQRLAVQVPAGAFYTGLQRWLAACGSSANNLVIPGGENRVVALMNGQIEATQVQLADFLDLDARTPGRYTIVDTGDLYLMSGAAMWANKAWLENNQEIATAYVAETLKTFQMIADNPQLLENAIRTWVQDAEPAATEQLVTAYRKQGFWPVNGGSTTILAETIRRFELFGILQPGLTVESTVDPVPLQRALGIVGQVPGSR
jgi:ABC-type nitrate/sulfonate/bicarbonate transport system substrate-binding protein